jgi:hypothetical protein
VKRLVDLTVEDLAATPVWRYEGGVGAEALVAPAKRKSLSRMDDEIFLASTEFELADSTRYLGFCFPADDSGIDYLQPVIISGSHHVSFWFDGPPAPEVLSGQWRTLGKEPAEIFPVAFRCLVLVDGSTVAGWIAGVESSLGVRSKLPDTAAARPVESRRRGIGTGEKRTARRRKAEMTVEFTQDALRGTGITGDISRRGMFVRSTRIPGTGPALRLTVNLPNGRKLFLTGRVVRAETAPPSVGSSGFGLRLADDWPDYEDLFSRRPK